MARRAKGWAPVDRQRGESADAWLRRAREAHRQAWIDQKIRDGEWLPPEEYERLTGRPGARLTEIQEAVARSSRSDVAPAAERPLVAPTAPRVDWAGHGAALARSSAVTAGVTFAQAMWRDDARVGEAAREAAVAGATSAARSAAVAGVREGLEYAAARVAGRELAKAAVKEAAALTATSAAKATLRGSALGTAAALVVDQGVDTYRLARGEIDGAEYARRAAENVGGAAGGLGGAAGGAALGTMVLPVVGTAIGAVVGGLLGSLGAQRGVRALVRR